MSESATPPESSAPAPTRADTKAAAKAAKRAEGRRSHASAWPHLAAARAARAQARW
ncbi:MAG: hypothetical protein R2713_19305 [Ilumatobacteraceae bacterium]